MKAYFALTWSVLLVGAICAVLALPTPDLNADSDSAAASKEELLLSFPEYSLIPQASSGDSSGDSDSSDSAADESGPEQPQGRTIFLLLRLLQLLAQSNSTLLG